MWFLKIAVVTFGLLFIPSSGHTVSLSLSLFLSSRANSSHILFADLCQALTKIHQNFNQKGDFERYISDWHQYLEIRKTCGQSYGASTNVYKIGHWLSLTDKPMTSLRCITLYENGNKKYRKCRLVSGQHTSLYYDDPSSNANEANIF